MENLVDSDSWVSVDLIGSFCALDNRHAFGLGRTNTFIQLHQLQV